MKRSKWFACLCSLLAVALIFSSCAIKEFETDQSLNGEGGSDIAIENNGQSLEQVTQTEKETTEEKTTDPPKYSKEDKLVALTFDDGPRRSTTNRILDVLEQHNGAATFFLVGYNIENNVETIKRAAEMGCEIANHSHDHKNLMKCTPEELREQVDTPNKLIKELIGIDVELFRAPGGNFTGVEEAIGMPLIQWSIDTVDWKYKDAAHKDRTSEQRKADIEKIVDHVITKVEKGDIILMHDIYDFTADLCDVLIPRLVEQGFKLATVSEMYAAYGKTLEGGKVYRCIKFNDETPAQAVPAGAYLVKTSGDPLNLRAEADASSESLKKIENGTVVLVTKSVPGWAYVKFESVSGWVNSKYLLKF